MGKVKKIVLALFAVVSVCTAFAQSKWDWANFGRYEEANAELEERPRAVFMGDSITDNWFKFDPGFFTDNGFAGRGISGQVTSQMLVRFRRDVIELSPKYVVILAGTNDIALNNGSISIENIFGNIVSMCELAKLHRIKPVICSVTPASSFSWRQELSPAEDIIRLNEMLREYAESHRIPYVDYHSALKDKLNGMTEGDRKSVV